MTVSVQNCLGAYQRNPKDNEEATASDLNDIFDNKIQTKFKILHSLVQESSLHILSLKDNVMNADILSRQTRIKLWISSKIICWPSGCEIVNLITNHNTRIIMYDTHQIENQLCHWGCQPNLKEKTPLPLCKEGGGTNWLSRDTKAWFEGL